MLPDCLVHLVYSVFLVHLVSFVQPNKRDGPNRPDRPGLLQTCWSRIGPVGSAELGRFSGEFEWFQQGSDFF